MKTPAAPDRWARAFSARNGRPVFSGIVGGGQVWEPDPFDVQSIHADVREQLLFAVERVNLPYHKSGQFMLVLGHAGAGKTHLMRALRHQLHREGTGYAAYLQLASKIDDPARYVLAYLIDSLEKRYFAPHGELAGLTRLAGSIARNAGGLSAEQIELVAEGDPSVDDVNALVDVMQRRPLLSSFDPDLLRVCLLLLRPDPVVRVRALKFLRAEPLSLHDQKILGGVTSAADSAVAMRRLEEVTRLIWEAESGATVFLVDQLEDALSGDDAVNGFERVVEVFRTLTEQAPSAIVVLSCLTDLWAHMKPRLKGSLVDRIAKNPLELGERRSELEIEQILSVRLQRLYEDHGIDGPPPSPIHPFTHAQVQAWAGMRTRDVLTACEQQQLQSIAASNLAPITGHQPPLPLTTTTTPTAKPTTTKPTTAKPAPKADQASLPAAWADAHAAWRREPPDDDAARLQVLKAAVDAAAGELPPGVSVSSATSEWEARPALLLTRTGADGSLRSWFVMVTDKNPKGGGLLHQLDDLLAGAKKKRAIPVAVRSVEFPTSRSETTKKVGALVKAGGIPVHVADGEWRTMMAWAAFREKHAQHALFTAFAAEEQPIAGLETIRKVLALDDLQTAPPATTTTTASAAAPLPVAAALGPSILVGASRERAGDDVTLDLEQLKMHAAFLGATGSGKTTLALSVIEQAALRGVPSVLVDRKGDLATYADPAFWDTAGDPPDVAARKRALAARLDVRLFTPGDELGHPMHVPLVPAGLLGLPPGERGRGAMLAASALAAMMRYGDGQAHQARLGVLGKAIELLASSPAASQRVTLDHLIDLVSDKDDELIANVGRLDIKHFDKLVDDLATLRLTRGELLAGHGQRLDAVRFFEKPADGRVPLTIITTKALPSPEAIEFWVTQLLLDLARFVREKPSTTLQGLVFLDEADLYLPATSKPATKDPLMDLLRRARSAGLGVLLATQSPGDFDYKCRENIRTWFVGRVSEERAVSKMRPLFADAPGDVATRLARQQPGEFVVLREGGGVRNMRAQASVMKTRQLADAEIRQLARQRPSR
ncbi:MAG: DUF87 domain-containing protein [Deltaproteobacteria bacterium]|nr:DUF87 domain-containing protein [Deltaproteobacteria bacterium]